MEPRHCAVTPQPMAPHATGAHSFATGAGVLHSYCSPWHRMHAAHAGVMHVLN